MVYKSDFICYNVVKYFKIGGGMGVNKSQRYCSDS